MIIHHPGNIESCCSRTNDIKNEKKRKENNNTYTNILGSVKDMGKLQRASFVQMATINMVHLPSSHLLLLVKKTKR